MPIYEYKCASCGKAEELIERLSASVSHDCGLCGTAQGMQRQLSVAAIASAEPGTGRGPAGPSPCAGGGCNCPFAS
jgi:putative FmdB family regulatory protein